MSGPFFMTDISNIGQYISFHATACWKLSMPDGLRIAPQSNPGSSIPHFVPSPDKGNDTSFWNFMSQKT
jgi:hypothetical protein